MTGPVQPVALLIPPDIQLGLNAGRLVRKGSVVRDLFGHIVKHLDEVEMPASESAAAPSAVALLRDRRVITVIGVTAIAGGSLTALAVKRQAAAKRCVKRLNSSLSAYLVAARDGALDEQAISRLIADLDDARRYSDNGQVAVAEAVVDLVVDYTARLAEANSIDLAELEVQATASQVVDLRPYLELQRRIVTGAA